MPQIAPIAQSNAYVGVAVPNPGRGWYRSFSGDVSSATFTPLTRQELVGLRVSEATTLVFRNYELDPTGSAIGTSVLQRIIGDLTAVRDAGMFMILRFTYNTAPVRDADGGIVPPYGDATPATVHAHVAALSTVLNTNADVVLVLQVIHFHRNDGNVSQDIGAFPLFTHVRCVRRPLLNLWSFLQSGSATKVRLGLNKNRHLYGMLGGIIVESAAFRVQPVRPVLHDGANSGVLTLVLGCT